MDKIQIIEKLFFDIVTYSYLLLPLTFLITIQKTRKTFPFFIYGFIFFLFLFFVDDFTTTALRKLYSNSYTFLEYLFFTLILRNEIKNQKFRTTIVILSILFLSFQVFYFLNSSFLKVDTIAIGFETILLFIYILFFFYYYFKKIEDRYIYNEPSFWFVLGILIYLGSSFFIFILANHLSNNEVQKYLIVANITEILKNLLFTTAMIMYANQPKKTKPEKSIPYLEPDLIN